MILRPICDYLDSDGRRFVFPRFGESNGLAYGLALDPRPKRWRHKRAAYDQTLGDLMGENAVLICPWPANDWDIVSFFKFAPDENRTGFKCRVYGELIA